MVTDKTLEKQGISPPVQREILFVLSYPQLRVTYISAEAAKLNKVNKTRKKFGNLFLLFRFDFSSPGRLEDFFAFFRGSERKKSYSYVFVFFPPPSQLPALLMPDLLASHFCTDWL